MQVTDFKLNSREEKLYQKQVQHFEIRAQSDPAYSFNLDANTAIKVQIFDRYSLINVFNLKGTNMDINKATDDKAADKITNKVTDFVLQIQRTLLTELNWYNPEIMPELATELIMITPNEPKFEYSQQAAVKDINSLFEEDKDSVFTRIYGVKESLLKVAANKDIKDLATYQKQLKQAIKDWAMVTRTKINTYQYKQLCGTGQVPTKSLILAVRGYCDIVKALQQNHILQNLESRGVSTSDLNALKNAYNKASISDEEFHKAFPDKPGRETAIYRKLSGQFNENSK